MSSEWGGEWRDVDASKCHKNELNLKSRRKFFFFLFTLPPPFVEVLQMEEKNVAGGGGGSLVVLLLSSWLWGHLPESGQPLHAG